MIVMGETLNANYLIPVNELESREHGFRVVKDFGAKVGDLLLAYNPDTQIATSAIIGDTGPEDNLGEGSVYLNMKLLNKTVSPTNKEQTFKLSIESSKILVAIIPGSRSFQIEGNKPYTAENIEKRFRDWQTKAGFSTSERFIEVMKSFQSKLN
jgi:hypothetical protein